MRSLVVAIVLIAGIVYGARPAVDAIETAATGSPCSGALGVPQALQLPRTVPPGEPTAIEHAMLDYLASYRYRDLGWCHDKGVRDTGPYVDHISYGTHPAVRIYYSPEMIDWLRAGRHGVPRDGAVMIKEQYGDKPAEFFKHDTGAELAPTDWTVMIRRSSASHDGWFWAEVYVGMFGAQTASATQYPNAGFGLYCLRCHSSAQKAMTFASLENVAGFAGEPLQYSIDNSWRTRALPPGPPAIVPAPALPNRPLAVQTFPPEPLDTYVAHAHVPHMFVTSDQCESCHGAGSGKPFGPVMWVTPAPGHHQAGINVSEYGEWRWSPMALAGRDPVFFAQLESETAYLSSIHDPRTSAVLKHQVTNICMTCHAAMGKRDLVARDPNGTFNASIIFDANPAHADFHDGGLGRDGISCALCHHIVKPRVPAGVAPLAFFLNHKINGEFDLGPTDKLFGPFADNSITTYPMNQAMGAKPRHSAYVVSSELCGSCHTINLPVVDRLAAVPHAPTHNIEQATYLEWLNSSYQTDYHPSSLARSCQACHMPQGIVDPARGVDLAHIVSRIAFVQDDTYPKTTNAASRSDLNVRVRKTGLGRHELLGLNAFLLTMFEQHPEVMGVRTSDYMSGSTSDLSDAVAHIIQQARQSTAKVRVRTHVAGRMLVADVEVVNLTGHRFPSGVGFRRAFLDFEVRDAAAPAGAPPLFASGRTDTRGRIVDANGRILPSESFARDASGHQLYQPHYDERYPITRSGQVQIFEELTRDANGNFTTSFIRRDSEVKDNRLLPLGWTPKGPTPALPAYFLHATYPKGLAASDPRYRDGRGHAVVRYVVALPPGVDPRRLRVTATLYYQSFAPYFIAERSQGSGPAATRFAALIGDLSLSNTAMRDWKIRIASSIARATPPQAGRVSAAPTRSQDRTQTSRRSTPAAPFSIRAGTNRR